MLQPLSLKVAKLHPNHELGLKLRQTRFCGYEKSFPDGPRGKKLRLLGVTDENGPKIMLSKRPSGSKSGSEFKRTHPRSQNRRFRLENDAPGGEMTLLFGVTDENRPKFRSQGSAECAKPLNLLSCGTKCGAETSSMSNANVRAM